MMPSLRVKNHELFLLTAVPPCRTFTLLNPSPMQFMTEKEACEATIGFLGYINEDRHPERYRECSFTILRTNVSPKPAIGRGDLVNIGNQIVGGNQSAEIVPPEILPQRSKQGQRYPGSFGTGESEGGDGPSCLMDGASTMRFDRATGNIDTNVSLLLDEGDFDA